jgi:hypothetical protein
MKTTTAEAEKLGESGRHSMKINQMEHKELLSTKNFQCIIIFIISLSMNAVSQELPIDIIDRINRVDYIFEGEVISSTPYETQNGRYIYTSNTIKISRILKGDLTCGTIELITDGGIVDERWVTRSHGLELARNCKGIFLTTLTDKELSSVDFYSENNYQKLEAPFQNQSFIKYWHDGVGWKVSDVWANYDSLAQVYNLAELVTGLNFVDCQEPSIFESDMAQSMTEVVEQETVMPTYSASDFAVLLNYVQHKKEHFTNNNRGMAGDKVFYDMENFIISGSSTKFLEFDITIRDNLGSGYLDLSAIRIVYNPAVFGSNVVTNSNIEITRGTINSDPDCYSDPLPIDMAPNAFYAMALETEYSQCKALVQTTPQKLMHLKMRIQNCNILSNIELLDTATFFDPSLILGISAYSDFPADTFSTFYNELQHQQTTSVPACVPTITSFTPTTVAGGIKEVLQIRGFQFGASRGSGTVFFKNANDGGNSEVACDDGDFLPTASWSDTLIQVYVPSADTAQIQSTAVPLSPAGTGTFKVLTNSGLVASSPIPVTIEYSVFNTTAHPTKPAEFLAPTFNQSGQFVFHLDSAVAHFQGGAMVPVIRKALKEWSCLTGIDWVLSPDSSYPNLPGPQEDSLCVIRFGSLGTNLTGATQLALNIAYGSTCAPRYYISESDLLINSDTSIHWFIDTIPSNPIPPGESDLYFALLHEIGHAHCLNHVIEENAVMHFVDNTDGAYRKIELYYDQSAYAGGNWVMDKSVQYPPSASCTLTGMAVAAPLCDDIFSVSEQVEECTLSIFPNPFSDDLTIRSRGITINRMLVYDMTGGEVLFSDNPNKDIVNLNLRQLESGVYLVKVMFENGTSEVLKAVKAK